MAGQYIIAAASDGATKISIPSANRVWETGNPATVWYNPTTEQINVTFDSVTLLMKISDIETIADFSPDSDPLVCVAQIQACFPKAVTSRQTVVLVPDMVVTSDTIGAITDSFINSGYRSAMFFVTVSGVTAGAAISINLLSNAPSGIQYSAVGDLKVTDSDTVAAITVVSPGVVDTGDLRGLPTSLPEKFAFMVSGDQGTVGSGLILKITATYFN